jgi:hypothetical protein
MLLLILLAVLLQLLMQMHTEIDTGMAIMMRLWIHHYAALVYAELPHACARLIAGRHGLMSPAHCSGST